MAELADVRVYRFMRDEYDDEELAEMGDAGFGGFGSPRSGFTPVGQGGIFGSIFKVGKSLIGKAGKLIKGGSSKVAKAAKAAKKIAATPTGQKVLGAGKQVLIGAVGAGAGAAGSGLLPMPSGRTGGGLTYSGGGGGGGGGTRGPSVIVDESGVAWRRAGRPVLWSGDLTAVKRVNKAAARARRATGSRRSVRRRA